MHYYKKNLGDYAKKAGRLSILQHGVYNLLIDSCYDREKFPTRDEAIDWVWAGTPEEIQAVDFVLSKFFILENGVYVQNRIAEEIEEYRKFCEKQAAKGKAGGRPKKAGGLKKEANGNPEENNRAKKETLTTNHEPLTTNQIKTLAPAGAAEKKPAKQDFHWEAMLQGCGIDLTAKPTKSERGAWNKALSEIKQTGADPPEILRRCEAYRRLWPKVSLTPTALARRWSECTVELANETDQRTCESKFQGSALERWEAKLDAGLLD